MVTQVKRPRSTGQALADALSNSAEGFYKGYGEHLVNERKQQEMQQKIQQLAQYYESIGLDPSLAMQPDFVQKEALKNAMKSKTWGQSIGNYFGGSGAGQRAGGGGNNPYANLTPEQQDQLRAQGIDVPLPNAPTSIAQRLSSAALGAGSTILGLPGDIASGAVSGINLLGGLFGNPNILPEYKQIQERMPQAYGNNTEQENVIREAFKNQGINLGGQLEKAGEETEAFAPPLKPYATSEQYRDLAKETAKDTLLHEYITPQTNTQKWYEDMGSVVSLLANPSAAFAKGGIKEAGKNLAKATGIAVGGDFAGWMTEDITGSKLLGDIVRNGTFLTASMWPGLMSSVAKDKYAQFDKLVTQRARKLGRGIDMYAQRSRFEKVFDKIDSLARGSEAHQYLYNEASKLQRNLSRKKFDVGALKDLISEQKRRLMKAPEQAKGIFKQMIDQEQRILDNFSHQISPAGAKALKDANRLYAVDKTATKMFKNAKQSLTGSLLVGPALLFSGGYKALLGLGAGAVAGNYVAKMLGDPTMRAIIKQIATASATNNSALLGKLMQKMDKRAKELDPKASRELARLLQQQQLTATA